MPYPLNPIFILFIDILSVLATISFIYLLVRIIWVAINRQKEIQRILSEAVDLLKENNRLLAQLNSANPSDGKQ